MCGITGAIALGESGVNIDKAKPMADRIAHRGPDDAGYLFLHSGCRHKKEVSFYLNLTDQRFKQVEDLLPTIESRSAQRELHCHDYDIYFGHRRLSILDITHAGHQPMSDLSKNIWLCYNGEIYNFKEIRAELEKSGHRFKSNTDTEVIIYAYIEWGIDCIHKFNGMFAFALYDGHKKKVFFARDRYGIKPLYYTLTKTNTLIFGSESKSILEYLSDKPSVDKAALLEYFTFQNIFTDKTLHENIHLLEAGHYLEVDLKGCQITKTLYWDFDFSEEDTIKDEREYTEELERLFRQAVELQMIADVEVGSYLSGGMDSGSISAIASSYLQNTAHKKSPTTRHSPQIPEQCLKTFTVGFDLSSALGMELVFDERAKAEMMSNHFKTEHYEMVLKSGDMERCLPRFAYHLEEPRVGQSYPNYYAAKLASKFVKVVLSGAGGDELFAGYPWRYYKAAMNKDFEDYIDKYYVYWQRLISNKDIQNAFEPICAEVSLVWTRDIFKSIFANNQHIPSTLEDYINQSLYFEAKTFLSGLLVVEDKLSMAHSIETRVPFLDNNLVDFAQKIPTRYKLRDLTSVKKLNENDIAKTQKTNDGKVILRRAMANILPESIPSDVKQGFSSPDESWFKGESIEFVKRKITDQTSPIYKYFSYDAVNRLVDQHLVGEKNRRLFVWSLLNFDEWCRQYG